MKIQIDHIVRDMTPEEAEFFKAIAPADEEAGPEDYESALAEMGVDFSD